MFCATMIVILPLVFLFGITIGSFLNVCICRKCKALVSVQYPLMELLNGLLWVGLVGANGFTPKGICYCIAVSSLLVLSVIDWRTYEIPLGCNIIILFAGGVRLFFDRADWLNYGVGFICVSGFLLLLLILSKGRAVGGGDVKLMAAAGLLIGWQQIILAFAIGCIAGSVIHLTLMKLKGKDRMLAFGPYLSFGIWFSMMWGQELISWYISLFLV